MPFAISQVVGLVLDFILFYLFMYYICFNCLSTFILWMMKNILNFTWICLPRPESENKVSRKLANEYFCDLKN